MSAASRAAGLLLADLQEVEEEDHVVLEDGVNPSCCFCFLASRSNAAGELDDAGSAGGWSGGWRCGTGCQGC